MIVALGTSLGLLGGWFGFRWRHKGRVFSEGDREYFQNLLYRAETAEAKLEQMEPELARATPTRIPTPLRFHNIEDPP